MKMKNLLIRGLPDDIHKKVQKMATEENLSLNQIMVRLITASIEAAKEKREEEERRSDAFRRIKEIREEIYREFGPAGDSTKIIREFRDQRNQKNED